MTTRFEMAEALVAWAKKRLAEQDMYQFRAANLRLVTTDLQISVKEILEHLRSALDYCARGLHDLCPLGPSCNVFFPIAKCGFLSKDFPSLVGQRIPGLLNARPDLVPVLQSFQEFASPNNWWLPDLATLCNESKHERLSVQQAVKVAITSLGSRDGKRVIEMDRSDKAPLKLGRVWMGNGHGVTFEFDAIEQETTHFLETALGGVVGIIAELKARI